jgi:predicted phage tail protein
MSESEAIARAITKLAEAIESLAEEMKEFRHDLRDEWLKVVVQDRFPVNYDRGR